MQRWNVDRRPDCAAARRSRASCMLALPPRAASRATARSWRSISASARVVKTVTVRWRHAARRPLQRADLARRAALQDGGPRARPAPRACRAAAAARRVRRVVGSVDATLTRRAAPPLTLIVRAAAPATGADAAARAAPVRRRPAGRRRGAPACCRRRSGRRPARCATWPRRARTPIPAPRRSRGARSPRRSNAARARRPRARARGDLLRHRGRGPELRRRRRPVRVRVAAGHGGGADHGRGLSGRAARDRARWCQLPSRPVVPLQRLHHRRRAGARRAPRASRSATRPGRAEPRRDLLQRDPQLRAAAAITSQGILHYSGTDTALIGNRIHHIGRQTFFDHGIYMKAGRRVVVANNVISDITGGYGLHIWGDFDDSWVINNTVYGVGGLRLHDRRQQRPRLPRPRRDGEQHPRRPQRAPPTAIRATRRRSTSRAAATRPATTSAGRTPAPARGSSRSRVRPTTRPPTRGSRTPAARDLHPRAGSPAINTRRELRPAARRRQARRAPTRPTRAPTKLG